VTLRLQGWRHAQGGIQNRAGPREGMTVDERGFSCVGTEKWDLLPEFCGPHTRTLKAQLRRMASNGRAPDQGGRSKGRGSKDELADHHGVAPAL